MNTKEKSLKSIIYVLLAGIMWGCMGILVRTLNEGGFTSMEVTAFRAFVTTIVMFGGMFLFNRKELRIRLKDLWCFAGAGILSVTFFNVCYFSCMRYTTLSVAAILLYTAPSFVIVMSFFLFKEKLGLQKILALVLAFFGCAMVSGGFFGTGINAVGLFTGLGAGFGYALYSIFSRYALQKGYSSYTITTYTFLFAILGTLPFIKPAHFAECMTKSLGSMPFAVFMAVITTVVAYLFYTNGLIGLENGKASIIASIEPVMASLVGVVIYGEVLQPAGIFGMILVLLSCFLVGKSS